MENKYRQESLRRAETITRANDKAVRWRDAEHMITSVVKQAVLRQRAKMTFVLFNSVFTCPDESTDSNEFAN